MSAQFIHDSLGLIDNQINKQIPSQNPMFSGQQSYFTQSMNAGSYAINPDLIAKTGKFINAAVYQRLYP